jgi:hypothetical protein
MHHKFQLALLEGKKVGGAPETPALMNPSRTNCLGCHIAVEDDKHGTIVRRGSVKSCVNCHTEEHEKMAHEWEDDVGKELKEAIETEKEAKEALIKAAEQLTNKDKEEYAAMLKTGRGYLDMVRFGHGVHNKKYSIKLIDEALNSFEDVLDELEE